LRASTPIRAVPGGVIISIRVITRASRAGVAGVRGDAILIRLHAPPVEGAANAELVEVLSAALRVPRSAVTIESGARGRQKYVRVTGVDADTASAMLIGPPG
jgi:uncharacterized protein (TIGR00251 family)